MAYSENIMEVYFLASGFWKKNEGVLQQVKQTVKTSMKGIVGKSQRYGGVGRSYGGAGRSCLRFDIILRSGFKPNLTL